MHAFRRAVLLFLLAVPVIAAGDWVRVVEDKPGRLELELTPPAASLRPAGNGGLSRVLCAGCQASQVPGAPDLPFYRFDVLSGPGAPQVTVQILESEIRSLPGGLASIPWQLAPTRLEYRPDPALFRAAGALEPRTSGIRHLRGAPVRGVEIPLALWSEATRTLTMIRRLRLEAVFPGVLPRPATPGLPPSFRSAVLNPRGGDYLYSTPRARLKRMASARSAGWPGERFLRIKVGDNTVESLAEDQVYAVSFDELSRAGRDLVTGIRVDSLRLYTGNNDTLHRMMDVLPVVASEMKGMLREIPMEVIDGGGNGTFDAGDTLKFFAHGTSTWKRIPGATGPIRYEFTVDPYSFENFYYLGFSRQKFTAPQLRMPVDPGLSPAGQVRETSPHYLRAEQDRETASCDPSSHKDEESGFAWFWHWKGSCTTYVDINFTLTRSNLESPETAILTDLVQKSSADTIHVGMYVYNPFPENIFKVYFGKQGDTLAYDTSHQAAGRYYALAGEYPGSPAFLLDSVSWSGREKRFEGYTVRYRRRLVLRSAPLWIFPHDLGARTTYQVEDAPGTTCLRIVDGIAERRFILDGQGRFTDSLPADSDARYLVYRQAARLPEGSITEEVLPASGSAIRDLLTGDGERPEYLIVTARSLINEAVALRNYRKDPARALPLQTSIVLVEDIYRQFGSGRLSPVAIRDFLRWAYNRWDAGGPASNPLKYVVLLGDGHYDYRGIHAARKSGSPPSLIPPYEFITSSGREEVASEEFYGNLDPGDNHMDSALLDIAIGRVPVQTPSEAANYIEKVKAYENPALAGDWRGRVVLSADDHLQRGASGGLDPITSGHTVSSEDLGVAMSRTEPGLNIDRLYLLDYPINSSFRKPEATQDILTMLNRGSLMVNYVGHGSSNQWADEVLLQTSDALSRLQNRDRTGLVNAFSCTVGRFESLASEGMSEQFIKQPGVGAIGAISATRESFPIPNIALADAFYSRVFLRDTVTGMAPTVGEALMQAKNSHETPENLNDSKYALLGEPVLLVRKPLLKLAFTQSPDTLRAVDCSIIRGTVDGGSGNGFINVKILAGSVRKNYDLPSAMKAQYSEKRGNILFERTFPYKNRQFSTEYFLPKQISFGDTNARITAFAWDSEKEMEGSIAVQDLRIQGTAGTCPADSSGQGPRIRITGCEKKETGDLDFPDRVRLSLPYCLKIQVEDSLGGVLSAEGPYEGTTVEIPGVLDPFHPQPGVDDLYFKSYQLALEAKDIRPGSHLLKVSAMDGYGNISMRSLRMDLTQDSSVSTITAYNIPNPVKRNGTAFHFSTILPQEEVFVGLDGQAGADRLRFEVRIYNQSGKVVKVLRDVQSGVRWEGRDEWNNRMANGVYFYTVTARWDQGVGAPPSSYRTISTRRNILVLSR